MERGAKRPLEESSPHLEPPSKKRQPALPDGTATGLLKSHDVRENSTPKALEVSSSHSDQITHTIPSVSHQFDTTADQDLCLLSLPEELLLNFTGFLTDSTDLHSLCLTSKLLGRIASPVLYRNIKLDETSTQFLLRTLLTRPDLSSEIRYLKFAGTQRIIGNPRMTSHDFQLLNEAVRDINKELNIAAGHAGGRCLTMLLTRLPRLQIFDITITPNFQGSFVHNLFTTACNPSSAYGQLFTTLRKVIMRAPWGPGGAYPLECFARLPHLQTLVSVGFYSIHFLTETSKTPSPPLAIKHVVLKNEKAYIGGHEWFRSFKCLESVTIQNWQGGWNSDFGQIGAILRSQQNSLKQICLAHFTSYLEPSNWRSIRPIGSLKHFEQLSRLMVPEYVLLGQNNYPSPVLIDILPQSLESIHITEWIGPHRDQIQCFHASCPQQFPNLKEVHIWDCHRPFKKGTKEAFEKVGIRFYRHSGSFMVDLE